MNQDKAKGGWCQPPVDSFRSGTSKLDLPVRIVLKCNPEMVFVIHRCEKQTPSSVLFNNTLIVTIH